MTGRIPPARIPGPRTVGGAGTRARPTPPRRDQLFLTALWQILVAMGGPFVPLLPAQYADDDPRDSGGPGGRGGSGWDDRWGGAR